MIGVVGVLLLVGTVIQKHRCGETTEALGFTAVLRDRRDAEATRDWDVKGFAAHRTASSQCALEGTCLTLLSFTDEFAKSGLPEQPVQFCF